ncbi:processed acidic surface protein [Bacillus sp. EB01]|uniref:processed acidic surface protein n=1 Tax=Bacillus sp. EB01 TaxID=1347086 RepID=UPI0005C74D0B|nr:processed acidic surface protein [Bacillus sp. EB01]
MKKIGVFLLALFLVVGLFPQASKAEAADTFEEDLALYLEEISSTRGIDITKEKLEAYLEEFWGSTLDEWETVAELKSDLGEIIKADLSNLAPIYEEFELDKAGLEALLAEYDEKIDDYIFVDDLYSTVHFYVNYDEGEFPSEEEMAAEYEAMLAEFDLTQEEIDRVVEHILSLEEKFNSEETLARLEALSERMMAFEDIDFTTVTELTAEQFAEILDIYTELLDLFELQAEYTLITNGEETPLSLEDLFSMDELVNAKLKISLYNLAGDLLADMIITGEDVDSGTIIDTGKDLEKVVEEVKNPSKPTPATVKGGKLPNTASDYGQNALFGLVILLGGVALFRKVRTR